MPFSDPAATRTRDRLLRRQMLYPAELPDLTIIAKAWKDDFCKACDNNTAKLAIFFF